MINFSGQCNETTKKVEFDNLLNAAEQYISLSNYAEAGSKLKEAISISTAENWDKERINTSISLAELMRRTDNYDAGLELLFGLENSTNFPSLHVRKLGRIAAIYHETNSDDIVSQIDSAKRYIDSALSYSEKYNILEHRAGLERELGFYELQYGEKSNAYTYLDKAAEAFRAAKDTENYVGTALHIANIYADNNEFLKADSLTKFIWETTKTKKWYAINRAVTKVFQKIALSQNDSLSYLKWRVAQEEFLWEKDRETHNNQMAAYLVLQETDKYRNQAKELEFIAREKEIQLKEEATLKNGILAFLISALISLGVLIFLFQRESKSKKKIASINDQLELSLDNYELLMLESNHRIKNNLQMVISLLRFSKKENLKSTDDLIDELSNKVHTISALHKQLTMNSHGEKVDLKDYFEGIINYYKSFDLFNRKINYKLVRIQLNNERTIYFGLILNELLSNTLSHGNVSDSAIDIILKKNEEKFTFFYSDGSTFDLEKSSGMGTGLIAKLIRKISARDVVVDNETGTYQFTFSQ